MTTPLLRFANANDVDAIFRVRYAVVENRLPPGLIANDDVRRAITETGRGWVIEVADRIEAFAIGDATTGNIWALFVHPDFEGRGYGSRLHDEMIGWLWQQGLPRLWLTTAAGSRAERFYRHRGWRPAGTTAKGEIRFEMERG